MYLTPKDWSKHQHYKNRCPPWIKIYHELLDDVEFHALPDNSKALLFMLWLIASEHKQGIINADSTVLAFRLRTASNLIAESLKPLISGGWFIASDLLADCKQHATPETETETETETEKRHIREETEDDYKNNLKTKSQNQSLEKISILKDALIKKMVV